MSMVAKTVTWKEQKRMAWLGWKENVTIGCLQLDWIHNYSNKMNNENLTDQLQNCYRFNHWMRNLKWCVAFVLFFDCCCNKCIQNL